MIALNTAVIYLGNRNTDVSVQEIKSGTVTKIGKAAVWLDHQHKSEDQLYTAFVWPDTEETRALLNDILAMSARHKTESLDMLSRELELSNKLIREGVK